MRRVIIITMLGTIGYSTLISFILPSIPKPNPYMLLDTVYGTVSAGNFSYWSFGQVGPLLIELNTVKGDADIFVGDNLRPSFEADRNNFSSETCGVDIVYIPEDFPRPIGIGIFGHWAHPRSEFMMKVYLDFDTVRSTYHYNSRITPTTKSIEDSMKAAREDFKRKDMAASKEDLSRLSETDPRRREAVARKEDEKPRFLKLFRVLDTVFDLFIL